MELVDHDAKLPAAVLGAEHDGDEAGDGAVMADQAPAGRLEHQEPKAVGGALADGDHGRHLGQQLRRQQPAAQQGLEEAG
jgi:hypothetical protein